MTGSRMLILGEAVVILARSTYSLSIGNSPAFIRRNRSKLSVAGRSRYGLFHPGAVSVPRYSRISSAVSSSAHDFALSNQILKQIHITDQNRSDE